MRLDVRRECTRAAHRRQAFVRALGIACGGMILALAATAAADTPRLPAARALVASEQIAAGQRLIAPQLSPDGAYVAYEGLRGNSRNLFILDLATARPRQVEVKKTLFRPASSYESELDWCRAAACRGWFVFVSGEANNLDLYLSRAAATELPTQLTNDPSLDYQPRFDPTGSRLVFLSGRQRDSGADLYLLELAGGEVPAAPAPAAVRLTNLAQGALYPAWSPDGRYVVYSAENSAGSEHSSYDLWMLDLNEARRLRGEQPGALDLSAKLEPRRLTHDEARDEIAASFSPAGDRIAFYASAAGGEVGRQPGAQTDSSKETKEQALGIVAVKRDGSGVINGLDGDVRILPGQVADPNEDSTLAGPVWAGDSSALVVVRDDPKAFNPILVVDPASGDIRGIGDGTRMNRDLFVFAGNNGAPDRILFSAHQGQSTTIYEVVLE